MASSSPINQSTYSSLVAPKPLGRGQPKPGNCGVMTSSRPSREMSGSHTAGVSGTPWTRTAGIGTACHAANRHAPAGKRGVVEDERDADVITASLADPHQFATVYDRHAGLVFRFLIRRVGRDTADELLGETFRIAFERRTSYDTAYANARPWPYG